MILGVTLLGLFMNASLTRAFTESGWAFVVPLLVIQLGRTAWTWANAPSRVYREQFSRILVWMAVTSPLWIAGAIASPEARLVWWLLAAGIDLLGTWLAQPLPGRWLRSEELPFAGPHMLERCGLFLLIALGETVLATDFALVEAPLTLLTLVTGTAALTGTVALWSLGFGRTGQISQQHVEATRDPVRASRHAVNALLVMVAGLIAVAVANESVIAHPQGPTSPAVALLLFGGPLIYLLAQAWYLGAVPRVRSHAQLISSAGLVAGGFIALALPPYVALLVVTASLVALSVFDRTPSQNGHLGRAQAASEGQPALMTHEGGAAPTQATPPADSVQALDSQSTEAIKPVSEADVTIS